MDNINKESSSSDHEPEEPTNVEPETKVVSDFEEGELLTSTIADDLSLSPSPPPTEQDELDKADDGSPGTVDRKRKYSSDGDDYQSDKDQPDLMGDEKPVGGNMQSKNLELEASVDVKLSDFAKDENILVDSNLENVSTSESQLLVSSIADDLSLSPSPPSSPVQQSSTSLKPSISKSLIASSMPSISLEPSTAPRPILSIKLPDVMHSSGPEPRKEQKSVDSDQSSSTNESHAKSSEDNSGRSSMKMDANSDDDREEMDEDELLKAIVGTSGTSGRKRNTASGGDDHNLDDDDEDSMDDDTLVDGRNRAEDLEFKTSFGLGLFGSSKDSNTNSAERDPKTFTKQEQEKLKEKLQEEERERMQ